jgi:hypothetical protein
MSIRSPDGVSSSIASPWPTSNIVRRSVARSFARPASAGTSSPRPITIATITSAGMATMRLRGATSASPSAA